jgi:hypothetical protein
MDQLLTIKRRRRRYAAAYEVIAATYHSVKLQGCSDGCQVLCIAGAAALLIMVTSKLLRSALRTCCGVKSVSPEWQKHQSPQLMCQ